MKKTIILSVGLLTLTIILSAIALLEAPAFAVTRTNIASVTVNSTCSFDDEYDYTSTFTLTAGLSANTESDSSKPTAHLTCNNPNGFEIDGIGFSPTASSAGDGVEGATSMYGASGSIATGTSGTGSYWSFKVSTLAASTSASTSYSDYSDVPATITPVATFAGSNSGVVTGTFRPDYQVHVSPTQAPGTYTGAVKYLIVAL